MVTITTAAPTPPSAFMMPTAPQLKKLQAIVWAAVPKLDPRGERGFDEAKSAIWFRCAFWAVSLLGRRLDNRPDHSKYAEFFGNIGRDLLKDAGVVDYGMPGGIFTAAMFAAGDIAHTYDPARYPYDFAVATCWPGTGRPADAAGWRRVLDTGKIRPATPDDRQKWSMMQQSTPQGAVGVTIGLVRSEIR